MAQRQVNVRLDEETIEVLEFAGLLDGRTLLDEVRAAIQARAAAAAEDPDVQEVLEVKRRRRNRETPDAASVVASLADKRRRARKPG